MNDKGEDHLTKFYPLEKMKDRAFVLYGTSLLAESLQRVLDEWLCVYGGTANYHVIEDPYWDFLANIRVCEALRLFDVSLIDDLALVTQLAALFRSHPRSTLNSAKASKIVNTMRTLETLDTSAAAGDTNKIHIRILRMNLGTTRDRFRMAVRALDRKLLDIAGRSKTTTRRRFNPKFKSTLVEPTDADECYRTALTRFESVLQDAIDLSHRAANRPSETSRIFWASALFTRLCNFTVSLARLAPGGAYSHHAVDNIWDNSAVSVLARAVFECFLLFFYLGIEEVSDDEWTARQNLMYLHDATMRLRVFYHDDPSDHAHDFYIGQRHELIDKLRASSYFQGLGDKRRAHFERGRELFFLTQDEIIQRIGWDQAHIRRFYEFLSAHVHSLPVAFYKMVEDGRGRGVENEPEKGYVAQSFEFVATLLTTATELYEAASAPYLEASEG